jgi:hypothetical protein
LLSPLANIKLGSAVSDIMGLSSRDMLRAIGDGEEDLEKLASLARRTMKRKRDELQLISTMFNQKSRFFDKWLFLLSVFCFRAILIKHTHYLYIARF